MYLPPGCQKLCLLFCHNPQGFPHSVLAHTFIVSERWPGRGVPKIDSDFVLSPNTVSMGWRVVIRIDTDHKSCPPQYGRHSGIVSRGEVYFPTHTMTIVT